MIIFKGELNYLKMRGLLNALRLADIACHHWVGQLLSFR